MTTLIKLGGSLITDKREARAFRPETTRQILRQVKQIHGLRDAPPLILGHGSGSFGHHEARKHGTRDGVETAADWLGFAKVAEAASALSQLVLRECVALQLPVMRLAPSALLGAADGRVHSLNIDPVVRALDRGLIPLLHGDVAFDSARGGTIISTEQILVELALRLDTRQIILLGEVAGVLDGAGELIRAITPATMAAHRESLGGASGVDVTGGMAQKVDDMLRLVARKPDLQAVIADGRRSDILLDLIIHGQQGGTVIRAR